MAIESAVRTIREPARDTPVLMEDDIVVVGGGTTGTIAAIAAARRGRRELAVPEARHLDDGEPLRRELLRVGEQVAAAEAVADRAGAHAHDVDRQAQVRVERDDLGNLAAADVHVVGERVGELGRDRPDVPAHPAQVVEQPGALARKLLQARRHAGEDIPSA